MYVLIIEDNPLWQIKLKSMLEEIEYGDEVCICDSIEEAKDKIAERRPELILSDIVLKNQSVFELHPIIQADNIPCILVTAYPDIEKFEKAMALLNVRFLAKPFHQLSLKSAIISLNIKSNKNSGLFVTGKFRQKILIDFDEILWLEAQGNYTVIQTINNKKYTIKKALVQIAPELDERFLRIQRAIFINTKFLSRVELSKGQLYVQGNMLKIGRIYRVPLIDYFSKRDHH